MFDSLNSVSVNVRKTMSAHIVLQRLDRHLPLTGLFLGTLFFALSLTPSLLPRTYLVQGILSGCAFAIGYAIGVSLQWIWDFMELKLPEALWTIWLKLGLLACSVAFAVYCLYQTFYWQNSVRRLMGELPVETGHPLSVFMVALVPASVFVLIGTILVHVVRLISRWLMRVVPRRVAFVGSVLIVTIIAVTLFNGVLLRGALRAADNFFAQLDSVVMQSGAPPIDPLSSGSAQSMIAWNTVGRDGRVYVQTGPSKEAIEAVTGRPAMDPLRVYVGLRSAETTEDRAELALQEMLRVGAFDRSVLVVIMPVGTGWVDPPSIDMLEYLMGGDVASVALQYSYLTSPLSLVVEPDYGTAAAQALFQKVYDHWTNLPKQTRPRLYLNGLSLGAHASQASIQVFDILGDPFHGALWVGPPFTSAIWGFATRNRHPDSPEWLPRFGNESSIRFTLHGEGLTDTHAPWGPVRIAFMQHDTDPIVFFDWPTLYRAPDWMNGERGPGVPPELRWYPVITFLQLALDMALGQTAPAGHGHLYAAHEYLDAWTALMQPDDWDAQSIAQLHQSLNSYAVPAPQ